MNNNEEKKVDYLIVGQGISGTMVAYQLLQLGKSFLVIDQFKPNSSSMIATGIVNPVTGRKMVKSWMVDDLLPFAKNQYLAIEALLGIQFYHHRPIYKIFSSLKEQNEFFLKGDITSYQKYLGDHQFPAWESIETPFGIGVIQECAWVDLKKLLISFRAFLKKKNCLLETKFDFQQIMLDEEYIVYDDIKANHVIFCEGAQAIDNPFFKKLPFNLAKGEVMKIKASDLEVKDGILNKGGQIIPIDDDYYNVGSTFEWKNLTEEPTDKGLEELKQKVTKITTVDFDIIEHVAGIRPTIKDRRPIIGVSEIDSRLFLLNGMGTKGISLSPYFSHQLINHIELGNDLISEVDIKRFKND